MEHAPESDWNKRYEESIRKEQAATPPIPRWIVVYNVFRDTLLVSAIAAAAVTALLTLVGVRSAPLSFALVACFFAVGLFVRHKIGQRRSR
jgi:hypothetical protein